MKKLTRALIKPRNLRNVEVSQKFASFLNPLAVVLSNMLATGSGKAGQSNLSSSMQRWSGRNPSTKMSRAINS